MSDQTTPAVHITDTAITEPSTAAIHLDRKTPPVKGDTVVVLHRGEAAIAIFAGWHMAKRTEYRRRPSGESDSTKVVDVLSGLMIVEMPRTSGKPLRLTLGMDRYRGVLRSGSDEA